MGTLILSLDTVLCIVIYYQAWANDMEGLLVVVQAMEEAIKRRYNQY